MSQDNQGSNEAFYLDKNGEKSDESIHWQILDEVDPAADYRHRLESFHGAIAKGINPEMAAKLYGIEGAFDLGPGPLAPG